MYIVYGIWHMVFHINKRKELYESMNQLTLKNHLTVTVCNGVKLGVIRNII